MNLMAKSLSPYTDSMRKQHSTIEEAQYMALMLRMTIQHIPCTIGSQLCQAHYVPKSSPCKKETYIQEDLEGTYNLDQHHTLAESLRLLYLKTELECATQWESFLDKQWQPSM